MSNRGFVRLLLISLALAASVACGTAGMETGPGAAVTPNGLYNSRNPLQSIRILRASVSEMPSAK